MNPRKIAIWLCVIALSFQAPACQAQDAHSADKKGAGVGKANVAHPASKPEAAKTSAVATDTSDEGTGKTAEGYQPDEALISAIRRAKLINADYPLRVLKHGSDEVLVTTLLNPKATEKNCKIEAVLVAKAIMEADKSVLRVHYRTKNRMRDQGCQVVTVRQSDVKAYGASAIDVSSLLGQLKLVKRTGGRRAQSE
jgi:hypothetical protein